MSAFGELLLYQMARRMMRSELGHSQEMKDALRDREAYANYRADKISEIAGYCRRWGVRLQDAVVLDLGCSDGAITAGYLSQGAAHVIGVDIDHEAVNRARQRFQDQRLEFRESSVSGMPVDDASIDTIICYDVFEHVSQPERILQECARVLRPGGKLLIATWGWWHPFAPHLWSTMPVPWAHLFFSERTVLRVCRRVFHSDWYVPNMHDLDAQGRKRQDKFLAEQIPTDYLNKLLLRDFDRVFAASPLQAEVHPIPFGSRYARWTRMFLGVPWLREFVTAAIWVVLTKPTEASSAAAPPSP